MKNFIRFFLSFFLLNCAISFCVASSSSSNENFAFYFKPTFGIKNGKIGEFVFENNHRKLSELEWNLSPEFFINFDSELIYKSFFVKPSFLIGIPSKTGKIYDSDWVNPTQSYKTHLSEHENYINFDFEFNLKAGKQIDLSKTFVLKPNLALRFAYFKFSAKNGKAWYTPSTEKTPQNQVRPYYEYLTVHEFSGTVMTYERFSFFTWLGCDLNVNLTNDIFFDFGLNFSPYLYTASLDYHKVRETPTKYLDFTDGFFEAYKICAGFNLKTSTESVFRFGFEYLKENVLIGPTYITNVGSKFYASDLSKASKGGTSEKYFAFLVSYKIKIF